MKRVKVEGMFLILIVLTILVSAVVGTVNAQVSSSGFAVSIPLTESEAGDGDIVCTYEGGFKRCDNDYDTTMYGVVTSNASVSIEDSDLENSRLVLTSGVATVKVSAINGNIEENDLITTSDTPGVGQLAGRNGYVLGSSLESYSPQNASDIGEIQVALNIHPAAGLTGPGSNLLQFIREGLTIPLIEPLESLRYILAVLMVIISFTLGMVYFGRSSRTGIEAVGRNPLAKGVIRITVVLNIILTIVIVLVGLAIAYLILVL